MKTVATVLLLSTAAALGVCVAGTAPESQGVAAPSSAPMVVKSAPPEVKTAPVAMTFAAPRPAPQAAAPGPELVQVTVNGKRYVKAADQKLYCRNDVETGSHIVRDPVCLTKSQLEQEQASAQQFIQYVQRAGGINMHRPRDTAIEGGML